MTEEQLLKAADEKMRISMSAVFFVDLVRKLNPLVKRDVVTTGTEESAVVFQVVKCMDDSDIA